MGKPMEVPSLPTDKLYKFATVVGILILGLAMRLTWSYSEKMHEMTKQLSVESVTLSADVDDFRRRVAAADSLKDPKRRPTCEEWEKFRQRIVRLNALATAAGVDRESWYFPIAIYFLIGLIGF